MMLSWLDLSWTSIQSQKPLTSSIYGPLNGPGFKTILLVFLCEAIANQLYQSKGCCGVSQVLGSMHHWLVTY